MKISCPCGEEIQIPDVLLEHEVCCPHCGQAVELPIALDAGDRAEDLIAEATPKAEESDELAIAIDSPVGRRAVGGARRPAAAAPNGNVAEEVAPGKRRDRLPIIITAAAFGVLIIVLVVVIAFTGDDAAPKTGESAGHESRQAVRPSAKAPAQGGTRGSYGGNADLFPGVPGNRTRKDYEEEQRRKRENGQ